MCDGAFCASVTTPRTHHREMCASGVHQFPSSSFTVFLAKSTAVRGNSPDFSVDRSVPAQAVTLRERTDAQGCRRRSDGDEGRPVGPPERIGVAEPLIGAFVRQ